MSRRIFNQPDLPFTGIGRSYRLALDVFVISAVLVLMAIAIAAPLTVTESRLMMLLIVPVVLMRGRNR